LADLKKIEGFDENSHRWPVAADLAPRSPNLALSVLINIHYVEKLLIKKLWKMKKMKNAIIVNGVVPVVQFVDFIF